MSIFNKEKLNESLAKDTVPKKHTVMIIDDEPINLTVFSELLSEYYNVLEAKNGKEALDHIEAMPHPEEIALIISDQRMPVMTGIELFKRLSKLIPETVRIIVTGYMDYDAVVASINEAQIYKFITKPIEREDFLLTIQRAIEHYETKQKLNEYVQNLESKVEDRTKAIKKKNIELKVAYRALKRLSVTDQLTGFFNRHYMDEYIGRDIDFSLRAYTNWLDKNADEEPNTSDLTFFLIDIDHFKLVNDTYGHSAGDKVLTQVCKVIRNIFRDSDLMVRWGGEEFLAISRFNNRKQSKFIAERLKQKIADTDFIIGDNKVIHKSCSIGFAHYPFTPKQPSALDWKEIVDIADKALYAAKYSGRNAWVSLESNRLTLGDATNPITENIESYVRNGNISVKSSFSDKRALKWGSN